MYPRIEDHPLLIDWVNEHEPEWDQVRDALTFDNSTAFSDALELEYNYRRVAVNVNRPHGNEKYLSLLLSTANQYGEYFHTLKHALDVLEARALEQADTEKHTYYAAPNGVPSTAHATHMEITERDKVGEDVSQLLALQDGRKSILSAFLKVWERCFLGVFVDE